MKSIKFFLCAMALCLSVQWVQAQEEDQEPKKGFDPSKLFFGGNFGLSFGSYTFVNVSPVVGYHFNKYFAAGTGVNFIYSNYKYYLANGATAYTENSGYAGLNVFGRLYPIQFLFLQVQPEYNYSWWERKYPNGYPSDKFNGFVPSILLGGGVAIPAGRGAFLVSANYDVVQDVRSPYGNHVFLAFGYNF